MLTVTNTKVTVGLLIRTFSGRYKINQLFGNMFTALECKFFLNCWIRTTLFFWCTFSIEKWFFLDKKAICVSKGIFCVLLNRVHDSRTVDRFSVWLTPSNPENFSWDKKGRFRSNDFRFVWTDSSRKIISIWKRWGSSFSRCFVLKMETICSGFYNPASKQEITIW